MPLSHADKTKMTRWYERNRGALPIDFRKSDAFAVFQAVDDTWESPATALIFSNAMDAAYDGLSNPQKKRFGEAWMNWKANQ